MYLVLLGVVAFWHGDERVPEITQTILGSFTATVGVVIAFFFGSSAYLEARAGTTNKAPPEPSPRDA